MPSIPLQQKFQQSKKCVLAIDDDDLLLKLIESCFCRVKGWQVLTTNSGYQGLRIAATAQPSVILLDVIMQEMDGITLFQHLQSDIVTQTIPIVLLTADVDLINTYRYPTGGIIGAIAKPFEPHRLVEQVTQYLDLAKR